MQRSHGRFRNRAQALRGGGATPYVGPLDLISSGVLMRGGSVARALRAAYTGPLISLRESGSNVDADIGQVDGLQDQAAAAAHIGPNSGFGGRIYDQSGSGEYWEQAVNANQPLHRAAGINGKPAFDFDGSNDRMMMTMGTPHTGGQMAMMAVI